MTSLPISSPSLTQARGLVLYVGFSQTRAVQAGTSLDRIARALRVQLAAMLPSAEASVSVVLGPPGPPSDDLGYVQRRQASRRTDGEDQPALVIDPDNQRVELHGRRLAVSPRELSLLGALAGAHGSVLSREALVDRVWGPTDPPTDPRIVDVTIRRLRVRLKEYGSVIRTVRGRGYRLESRSDVRVVAGRASWGQAWGVDDQFREVC